MASLAFLRGHAQIILFVVANEILFFLMQQDKPAERAAIHFSLWQPSTDLRCNYGMVEHQGLISRPGLWGKKQDASLTSTGPNCTSAM